MEFSLKNRGLVILIRWTMIIFAIFIVIYFLIQVTTFTSLKSELKDKVKKEKEYYIELSQRIDSIEVLIEKIQTDSSYIEKLARENLGIVKKDEKVFKFKKIENNDPE